MKETHLTPIFVYAKFKQFNEFWSVLKIASDNNNAIFVNTRGTAPIYDLVCDSNGYTPTLIYGKTSVLGEVYEVSDSVLSQIRRLLNIPSVYSETFITLSNGSKILSFVLNEKLNSDINTQKNFSNSYYKIKTIKSWEDRSNE